MKPKCLGGYPKGFVCDKPAGCPHSPYWCVECNEKRMEQIGNSLNELLAYATRREAQHEGK